MKFGLFDHIDRRDEPLHDTYQGRLRLVEAAEQAGFYAYHLAEHHWTPLGMAPSPSVFLGSVIERTRTIHLGPMVYLLPLYHPLRLIEEICMLDQMSGGRLEIGVGRGVSPFEVAYFGVNAAESYSIYHDALEAIIKGLTSEYLDYRGEHFKFYDVPMEMKPLQRPYPPLWVGGGNTTSMDFTARYGCNMVCIGPTESIKDRVAYYREAWDRFADDRERIDCPIDEPLIGSQVLLFVAETDAEAERIALPAFERFYQSLEKLWVDWRARPAFHITDLALARKLQMAVIGSPARVRETLEERFAVTGTNYAVLEMAWGTLGHDNEMRSMRLFADEVMPHFADGAAPAAMAAAESS